MSEVLLALGITLLTALAVAGLYWFREAIERRTLRKIRGGRS